MLNGPKTTLSLIAARIYAKSTKREVRGESKVFDSNKLPQPINFRPCVEGVGGEGVGGNGNKNTCKQVVPDVPYVSRCPDMEGIETVEPGDGFSNSASGVSRCPDMEGIET